MRMNNLQVQKQMTLIDNILRERSQIPEYILYNSIYVIYKTRQTYMLLKVKIMLTFGRRGSESRQVRGESFLVFGNILFSHLGADYMDIRFVKTSASYVLMCTFPCVFIVK